ncbi:hypothetical protein PROFUN_10480 [Planoprotostelium fungivorum]|uniref:Amidohydrolase-related domain-containing protein n=1 Tax=Planoprotostelium fungivorum TaxID=1890364 RepID=A0A2P6NDE5_9EUKA|nr:hypothetical protein PROFUN_10480 [Planoprotostelium fungivorum]
MFIIYGNFIHTPVRGELEVLSNHLMVVDQGIIVLLSSEFTNDANPTTLVSHVMSKFPGTTLTSLLFVSRHQFIVPGMIDTHVHAPQFVFHGSATGVPLMEWLHQNTFPAESKMKDVDYAKTVWKREASQALADEIERRRQRGYVGKINMDRNSIPEYIEDTQESIDETEKFLQYVLEKKNPLIRPVITPRFIPTCSPHLLAGLGELAEKYGVHVQSHIAESDDQMAFVEELHPRETDTEIFEKSGLLTPLTVMAHGTHLRPSDVQKLVSHRTAVASCPLSNFFFSGKILPLQRYHSEGLTIGLGSDLAGGYAASMLHSVRNSVIASRNIPSPQPGDAFDFRTGFWHATVGGAKALSLDKLGCFRVGMEFDALMIDVSIVEDGPPTHGVDTFEGDTTEVMFEKWVNCGDERNIKRVWVAGELILKRE